MFCKNCGTQNTDNSNFCMNCGASLNNENITNITKIINEIPPIQQQQFNNNVKNVQPKKDKKAILIIMGIIVLIVMLALWFMKNRNNNNYGSTNQKSEISYSYSEGNIPKFIDGSFSSDTINSSEDVLKVLENIKDEMKFKDVSEELKLISEETNEDMTYYKFEQIYN
ncbi:MAG: zinc-ribbon domain-containing protein, partial [Bacilli bacterium]|nr:zinc-ribbon domain-containing protein [Bacilli bacterium]